MIEFDERGLFLCKYQASLFEKASEFTGLSSPDFIRKYMNSKYAKMVDSLNFIGGEYTEEKILEEMNERYKKTGRRIYYGNDIMHWIGYLYRYWSYSYRIPSKQVFKYISGVELYTLYESYHTLDCSKAVERIMEARKIKQPDSLEIMKRIKGDLQ